MADNLRVIIAAAGVGSRMKNQINKQYLLLKDRPVLAYSLDFFEQLPEAESIVIVANPAEVEYCEREIVSKYGYKKVNKVIPGGKERQDSVWNALQQMDSRTEWVGIHDGARPILTVQLVKDLFTSAQQYGAAIPGLSARETIKRVDEKGVVLETLDRSTLVTVQTPQIFSFRSLVHAYEKAYAEGFVATDDASVFEKYAGPVKVVEGIYTNIKITTPVDITVAETFLNLC